MVVQMLKKTYTVELTIQEGDDEFWEALQGRSGCDEVVEEVRRILTDTGFSYPVCRVRLTGFSESP